MRPGFFAWILILCVLVPAAGNAVAQAAGAAPVNPNAPKAATPTPENPEGYSYNTSGRRDPFVPLLQRGSDARPTSVSRPEGLPGVAVNEVAIKGIIQSLGSYVAMLQAPDTKTYIVRNGDRLFDASVKLVTADAVVFIQQVNDPMSLVKQREIRRPLRPLEEGK